MQKLIQNLWAIFLVTFPLSMRFLVYEQHSYRFGNFNPWVTGFVYLPELLLIGIFTLWTIREFKLKKLKSKLTVKSKPLWIFFLLFVINGYLVTLLKGDALLGAFFLLRIFEGLMIFWLVKSKLIPGRQAVKLLLIGVLIQIIWAIGQWQLNRSLGLTWLGESVLGPDILGVAKTDLTDGTKQIRSYGSFLHPNILGAYLVTIFFLALKYFKHRTELFWIAVFTVGIYLTGSQAAIIVGFLGIVLDLTFKFYKKHTQHRKVGYLVIIALLVANFWLLQSSASMTSENTSWQERFDQNAISQKMINAELFGVGVGNFTLEMEKYTGGKNFQPWEFQPVHNAYLLILNETGLQGIIILFALIFLLFHRYWHHGKGLPLFILLFFGLFDHLLWTSWVGLILIAMTAGFFALEDE